MGMAKWWMVYKVDDRNQNRFTLSWLCRSYASAQRTVEQLTAEHWGWRFVILEGGM